MTVQQGQAVLYFRIYSYRVTAQQKASWFCPITGTLPRRTSKPRPHNFSTNLFTVDRPVVRRRPQQQRMRPLLSVSWLAAAGAVAWGSSRNPS